MRLPTIQGIIRRRILANYRIDPEIMQQQLPSRFTPKLHHGFAVAGICLIRLEHIRPKSMPEFMGISSENAAHRVAVLWEEEGSMREGVYITRRDTDSRLSQLLGGRIFPGEHHAATFTVADSGAQIKLSMRSADSEVELEIEGSLATDMPESSIFSSVAEASSFFEEGSVGYSATRDPNRLDGLKLVTEDWSVAPLQVSSVHSSYFADKERFPIGSITFDHALVMRNIEHEWHSEDDLYT